MRYGIVSDVHANLPALEAVFTAMIEEGVESFVCLGDLVGYGASPNECCEVVRQLPGVCVRGNHDEAAIRPGRELWFTPAARECILWTREVLTTENREYLEGLPSLAEVEGALLCHGSLPDPDFYITSAGGALPSLAELADGQMALFGHTHYAVWYSWRQGTNLPHEKPCPRGGRCEITDELRYLINPGAVGQPRDGNARAGFALWDTKDRSVRLMRVEYDIRSAQERMYRAGLPDEMAFRLEMGI